MRQMLFAAAAATIFGIATAGCSGTAPGPVSPAVLPSAQAVTMTPAAPHPFTCTGTQGRYYTKQTVNGVIVKKKVPKSVTVLDWQNRVLITVPKPVLDNAYDGGYWKQTYHLNEWKLGHSGTYDFHLMLPDTRLGRTFQAMLKTDFDSGGNWQNWMDCRP